MTVATESTVLERIVESLARRRGKHRRGHRSRGKIARFQRLEPRLRSELLSRRTVTRSRPVARGNTVVGRRADDFCRGWRAEIPSLDAVHNFTLEVMVGVVKIDNDALVSRLGDPSAQSRLSRVAETRIRALKP